MMRDILTYMSENVLSYSPAPANENADPFRTVPSSLDWLYLLRRELLQHEASALSFEQRRVRDEALKKFAHAETLLLAEL